MVSYPRMKTKHICLSLAGATALILVGCHNPADDVPEAQTGQASDTAIEAADGTAYVFTEDSKIGFIGSKVTGSHDGGFNEFSGKFLVADGKLLPGQPIVIDMNSTWTDTEKLTGHLKSPDFFDVAAHPTATFTPTEIQQDGDSYLVTGNLTLRGVTKSIMFPADISISDDEVKLQAEFFINRFDFDVKYKGKADDLIREEVVINLDITAKPEAAAG